MARATAAVLTLALCAWPGLARAYRPFDSTDAAVAARGTLELELGPVGWLAEGRERSLVLPSAVVNWGFAPRWETVVEARRLVRLGGDPDTPRSRLEGGVVSLKHVVREGVLQEGPGASVAVEASLLVPTEGDAPWFGAQGAVIASHRAGPAMLHVNAALAWSRAHVPEAFGGIIVEGPVTWTVRPVAEAWADFERGRRPAASVLAGGIWRVRPALAVDAGVRIAREEERAVEVRAGITWGFDLGFPGG